MREHPTPQPCKQTEKQHVAAAFSRAASTYDSVADFQRAVGTRLLSLLPEPSQTAVQRWLDMGCGTGYFCQQLQQRWPHAQGIGLDLAEGMLSFARNRCPELGYICADAEQLPLPDNSQDLVFSSLALQWCADRQAVANELYRVSKPGGAVHFSTLVAGSLTPLEHLVELGLLPVLNNYPAAAKWQQHLLQAGFTQVQWQQVEVATFHNSGTDLLRSMKNIGASQRQTHSPNRAAQGLRTPHWLQQVNAALEHYRQPQGIPLNYQVALLSATKGSSKQLHL